jgi:hypothetical protein
MVTRVRVWNALLRWLRRYLPAELVCTPCALLCGFAVSALTGSTAAAAVASTWGENAGFYGTMLVRELRSRGLRSLPAVVRDLFLEFGPAEVLDSFLVRPAAIYAALLLAPHPALGIVAGKLAADVSFYAPAIVSHELQRWYARAVAGRVARSGRVMPVFSAMVVIALATASFA